MASSTGIKSPDGIMELYEDHRVQVREIVQDIDDSEPLLEKKKTLVS